MCRTGMRSKYTWIDCCINCMRPLQNQGVSSKLHAKMHSTNAAVLAAQVLLQLHAWHVTEPCWRSLEPWHFLEEPQCLVKSSQPTLVAVSCALAALVTRNAHLCKIDAWLRSAGICTDQAVHAAALCKWKSAEDGRDLVHRAHASGSFICGVHSFQHKYMSLCPCTWTSSNGPAEPV